MLHNYCCYKHNLFDRSFPGVSEYEVSSFDLPITNIPMETYIFIIQYALCIFQLLDVVFC